MFCIIVTLRQFTLKVTILLYFVRDATRMSKNAHECYKERKAQNMTSTANIIHNKKTDYC